jgi:uncharacterized protein
MATRHQAFEWNAYKAASNLKNHGVTFEDAARVLADPMGEMFQLENFDDEHSTEKEDRWITIGSEPEGRDILLFIVWTPVFGATRIISARLANKRERREYEAHLAGRLEE